jgi:hypothetical protein
MLKSKSVFLATLSFLARDLVGAVPCNVCGSNTDISICVVKGVGNLLPQPWNLQSCQAILDLAKAGLLDQGSCDVLTARQPPVIGPTIFDSFCECRCPETSPSPPVCFSAENTLEVQGKGLVRMDALQVGDSVKTKDNTFSRVYSLGHLDRDVETDFLQIHAQGLDRPLEISHDHFLFINHKLDRAGNAKVGDIDGVDHKHRVTEIIPVKRRGFYAPTTESGTLEVSGVLSSCYVPWLPDLHLPVWFQAYVFHVILAPRRVACRWNFDFCEYETFNEDGFSSYLVPLV